MFTRKTSFVAPLLGFSLVACAAPGAGGGDGDKGIEGSVSFQATDEALTGEVELEAGTLSFGGIDEGAGVTRAELTTMLGTYSLRTHPESIVEDLELPPTADQDASAAASAFWELRNQPEWLALEDTRRGAVEVLLALVGDVPVEDLVAEYGEGVAEGREETEVAFEDDTDVVSDANTFPCADKWMAVATACGGAAYVIAKIILTNGSPADGFFPSVGCATAVGSLVLCRRNNRNAGDGGASFSDRDGDRRPDRGERLHLRQSNGYRMCVVMGSGRPC